MKVKPSSFIPKLKGILKYMEFNDFTIHLNMKKTKDEAPLLTRSDNTKQDPNKAHKKNEKKKKKVTHTKAGNTRNKFLRRAISGNLPRQKFSGNQRINLSKPKAPGMNLNQESIKGKKIPRTAIYEVSFSPSPLRGLKKRRDSLGGTSPRKKKAVKPIHRKFHAFDPNRFKRYSKHGRKTSVNDDGVKKFRKKPRKTKISNKSPDHSTRRNFPERLFSHQQRLFPAYA